MKRFWDRLTSRSDGAPAAGTPPRPNRLSYFIGDIHGSRAKLDNLLDKISRDRAGREADIVFLGDYVDRGEDTAGVLGDLHKMEQGAGGDVICLVGNHDRMMLEFLNDPSLRTGHWLAVGGLSTLASFGLSVDIADDPDAFRRASEGLKEAMGQELVDWLDARPLWWRSGNVVAVHALTEPSRPMEQQDERTLLWARPWDGLRARQDGSWVVHGHTVISQPAVRNGHIAVDTGACSGYPLSAAVLDGQTVRFLQSA